MDELDWIRKGLEKPGKTQIGIARAIGREPSAVTNLLKRDGKRRKLQLYEIQPIADYLEVDPPGSVPERPRAGAGYRPPPELFGDRDMKVFAAVEGGPGEMVVSTEPIEIVPRPWYLREVRDGYGVLIVGESMVPVFEPGDIAVVNPRLPAMRNKDHILIADRELGEFRASIKRLVSWTNDLWRLHQFNPPKGQKHDITWSKKRLAGSPARGSENTAVSQANRS